MNETEFWDLIAASRAAMTDDPGGSMDRQAERLHELLVRLDPAAIVGFPDRFDELDERANDYDLWAVAYIIGNGCSDGWFEYFRYWLVSLGREGYERVLKDPAAVDALLAETDAETIFFEEISYVAEDAYRDRTGSDFPDRAVAGRGPSRGRRWADETELERRYPALWTKHWSGS